MIFKVFYFVHTEPSTGDDLLELGRGSTRGRCRESFKSAALLVNCLLPKPSTCLEPKTKASAVAKRHSVALQRLSEEMTTESVILPKMVIFQLSQLRSLIFLRALLVYLRQAHCVGRK